MRYSEGTPMPQSHEQELKEATDAILNSKSVKKLIVAGPGTGKTFIFKKLITGVGGTPKSTIVLTFINTLKADLHKSLSSRQRTERQCGWPEDLPGF
jgi:superfamily II DNA or RNA helicase